MNAPSIPFNMLSDISLAEHIIIVPILLPLLAASTMLLIDERRRRLKAFISLAAILAMLGAGLTLFVSSAEGAQVYLLGNWVAPFGISLVADQLSATMLVLTGTLGFFTLLFSFARWDRAGPRFLPFFMLLLMGLNGAFLTGDIFNLFVFFEVLLAASYALALHGSGTARVRAGLHYIAINLAASSLFLIGAALIYGTSGTLNMADIAIYARAVPEADAGLFNIGLAVMGVAFLAKAGTWPLGFWLAPTYSTASAPVAAVFAIMSKVGIYAILRLMFLTSNPDTADLTGFYSNALFVAGIATIVYGSVVVLSSRTLSRIASGCIFISSGTLLCGLSIGTGQVLAASLYYLLSSTLAVAAFFLLIELMNRARGSHTAILGEPVFADEYQDPFEDGRIDETQSTLVIPAALALLSGGFLFCAILLAGMPPMAGFIGKFALIDGVLAERGVDSRTSWVFIALLIISSLATIISFVRIGIEALWVPRDEPAPRIALVEFFSIAGLLLMCAALTVASGPAMARMSTLSTWLLNAAPYSEMVMRTPATVSTAVSSPSPAHIPGAKP